MASTRNFTTNYDPVILVFDLYARKRELTPGSNLNTLSFISTNPPGLSPHVYGAVGDSYGACYEIADPSNVHKNNDLHNVASPSSAHQAGHYSDDTQMHLAIGELIASQCKWTPENIANAFVTAFKRDPRSGYAKGFGDLLIEVSSGDELRTKLRPHSERNGAAMRAPIIGLFPAVEDVIARSELQARVTHDTKTGRDSAVAAALTSHYFAYDLGSKELLPKFLDKFVPGYHWGTPWTRPVTTDGISTVRAALSAILRYNSLAGILKACIDFTGDVDTVATIALASASNNDAFARDIPDSLWNGAERSAYGIDYLADLDARVRKLVFRAGR